MHTFNQDIDTGSLRRETFDGREHLVAPITILKPMVLNTPEGEAYLPEAEAKRSAPAWNGTPLTLNHPSTPDGMGTTANTPGMLENVKLGQVFNAEADSSGKVKAEAWFDIEKIQSMGGNALDALNAVLDGDTVEVSSGYQADVAKNEHADGKSRDKIQGNLRPDHVAVLPNDMGKCSVSDGCGVGVAANQAMIFTNAQNATFSDDDIVQWESSGGMAMGRIVDMREEGEAAYDAEIDGDVTVEPPAALIEVLQMEDGELVPQDVMVAHKTNTDTLSHVEDPAPIAENQDVPEEYVFDNPGEAMSKAQEMGLDSIHTHGEGDDTVFMPAASHAELMEMITNADDGETPEDVGVNYLSEARDPTYDGTEDTSWGDVPKTLSHWTDALDIDAESVDDMTQSQKETVAAHTLLGDAEGDSWGEVLFFPVVNPSTSNLNAGALRAVLSGRGETQETVPESAENSAQEKARMLLEEEFDSSDNSGHMDEEEEEEMNTNDSDTTNMSDCTCNEDGSETEEVSENEETIEISKADLESLVDERVEERLAANKEQSQRDELVGVITANSEEYSEESLSDTPVDVLESIAANVQGGVDFGPRGASPKPATNTEDVDAGSLKLFGSDA